MNRSLMEVLQIASELKAIYDPIAGKNITTTQAIAAALAAINVLNKHNVTLAELSGLLSEIGPFLSLVK